MSSVVLLLKANKVNKDGEMPLYIRIIKNRKTKFISLGINLLPDQWDAKNKRVKKHKNSARLNNFIVQKLAEANNIALEMETKNRYVSSNRIKDKIMGKTSSSFTEYSHKYRDSLEAAGKMGTHDKVNAVLSKLEDYLNNAEINFGEIDVQFLLKYENYLRKDKGNSTNTIHSNLKIIRKLFNDAIRDEIIEPEINPFIRYKLKWEKPQKEYLTESELKEFENVTLTPDSMLFHHRNAYIFAAYAGGIRISDLLQLQWKNFDGSHITFIMQKTNEAVSIKLPSKALDIINYYKKFNPEENENFYIFPFLKNDTVYDAPSLFKAISSRTAYANKDLKDIAKMAEISKHISFHSSRHTWATRALRKGMRIEYVSKLMGHSSIKTTQVYAKIVNSELDKAMDIFNE